MLNGSQACYSGFPHTATKVLLCLSLDGVPEEDYVYSVHDFTNLYVGAPNIIFNIIEQDQYVCQHVQRDIEVTHMNSV